jgi:RHS repeat-associated protein
MPHGGAITARGQFANLMLTLALCGAAGTALAQREKVEVQLTAPANASVHHDPATIELLATARSALLPAIVLEHANPEALAITKVEFFAGANLIGTALGQQPDNLYRITWTNPTPAIYAVTAKATNNLGNTALSTPVTITVNARPAVSIVAPQHQSVVTAPASVVVSAQATDADGAVASVEFFNGSTAIGSATAAPFSTTAANLAAGTYTFSARVTDNHGATSVSSPVTVILNAPPTVSLNSPAAIVTAPGSFQISAAPTDADGTVQKVDFFQGGTPIATSTSAPFTASIELLPWGTYTYTALVTDNHGATGTSTPLSVRVNAPPSVTLSSPSISFRAPANIPISALPLDLDGTIASVQVFNGTTPIATLTGAPFNLTWQSVPQGTYTLSAVVTDDLGATVTSAPFQISVASAEMKLYFIHVDHLNTPRMVADEQQRTVWRWDQNEPFGNDAPRENPESLGRFEFPLRFPGQYYDVESALHYNFFRDYDPLIGRYVEPDPTGLEAGLLLYGYVHGNPLSYIDPLGLDVRVSIYHGMAGGLGHVGIGVVTERGETGTVGFYPNPNSDGNPATGVPGAVLADPSKPSATLVIQTSPQQDQCITDCINERTSNPGTYSLFGRNCNDFIHTCFTRCGIRTNNLRSPPGFFNYLRRQYPKCPLNNCA